MTRQVKKRGFSIMEAVIAILIITMVSLTAVTIVTSSLSIKAKNESITIAQNIAHDAWECFKVSENETEFLSYMSFAGISPLTKSHQPTGECIYTYSSGGIEASIIVTPPAEGEIKLAFSISVAYDGEELISFSYNKAKGEGVWKS